MRLTVDNMFPLFLSAKVARLVLAAIPPAQRNMGTQIQSEIISDYNKVKPIVKVTYKDKKELEVDPSSMNFQELANHFDRHSKQLDLKHMLENALNWVSRNKCVFNIPRQIVTTRQATL